jgi:hypothetical protein
MVFYWGKHVKQRLVKVDTGKRLKQTCEGKFHEADTGERMFCQCKHMKEHVMKDFLLMTDMYWCALLCIIELHLSGLHREKCTKNLWWCAVVCCCFQELGLIGCTCWGKTHAKPRHMEDTWCLEGINRTSQSGGDRAWLAGTASFAMLVGLKSLLIFASLIEAQLRTCPGVPVGPSCCVKPRLKPGCLC